MIIYLSWNTLKNKITLVEHRTNKKLKLNFHIIYIKGH